MIDKFYEAEWSFKPTFAEDLFDKDKVKSLCVIRASTIRRFGDQIKLRRSVNAMVSDSFPGQFLFNM